MSSAPVHRTVENNCDPKVTRGFGEEWSRFDQRGLSAPEHRAVFDAYFQIFPWELLPPGAAGVDVGCGSGRWAKLVAPRVGLLHCVDASAEALGVARSSLSELENVQFHHASVSDMPIADDSLDFGYSLGVLHHVPDTHAGLDACVRKLKPGAPFLVYLYYALDNRPWWFRSVWRASDGARRLISRLPRVLRYATAELIAGLVYWPLSRTARLLESLGGSVAAWPLSAYRDKSYYTMRTDALDRFGTRLEQRFSRKQIAEMMARAGLENIRFSEQAPYWCAIGIKRS